MFSVIELTFPGHIVSKDGLKIDPKKCSAIVDMPMPTNKTELQGFLGMLNYIGKFIPNLSQVTQPLRILLKKDLEFLIDKPQVDAINELKGWLPPLLCCNLLTRIIQSDYEPMQAL